MSVPLAVWKASVAPVVLLVACVPVGAADGRTTCRPDRRSFERTAGLITDDPAEESAAKGSSCGSALSIRPYGRCAVGK